MLGKNLFILLLTSLVFASPVKSETNNIDFCKEVKIASPLLANAPNEDEPEESFYCKLEFKYVMGNVINESGSQNCKTEEEYISHFVHDTYHYFEYYHVTFYQENCKAVLVASKDYVINANGHSFSYVNSAGNTVTDVQIIGTQNPSFIIKNATKWNFATTHRVTSGVTLTLDNCSIEDQGSFISKDLFILTRGAHLKLINRSAFRGLKFSNGARVVKFTNEGNEAEESSLVGEGTCHFFDIDTPSGAVFLTSKNAKVEKVDFTNCGSTYGGAIYQEGGTVESCFFFDCHADQRGGAVYISGPDSTVNSCSFDGCNTYVNGGAICINSYNSKITNCLFVENQANSNGGAIYFGRHNCLIDKCIFSKNSSNRDGGAICVNGNSCTISNSEFYDNNSGSHGGAIYVGNFGCYDCVITYCVFSNNKAISSSNDVAKSGDTVMSYCSSTVSNGNVILIIVISSAVVLVAAGIVLFKFRDKIFKKRKKAE